MKDPKLDSSYMSDEQDRKAIFMVFAVNAAGPFPMTIPMTEQLWSGMKEEERTQWRKVVLAMEEFVIFGVTSSMK